MEENLNENVNENVSQEMNTEALKNEAKETFNQVKEELKNVNVKEDAKAAKGFILEMFENPVGKIAEIAQDGSKYFKTSIVLIVVWMAINLVWEIRSLFYRMSSTDWLDWVLGVIKTGLAPIASVLAMAIILLWLNKKEKKSLTTCIATIAATKLPIIFAKVVGLLGIISYRLSDIIDAVSTFARLVSTVLLFMAIKALSNETDDKSAFRRFFVAELVWVAAYYFIGLLGIIIV